MKMFVHSQEFKKMNIGLTLDEGLASPTDEVPVYYGERNVYWVKFKIAGVKVLSTLIRDAWAATYTCRKSRARLEVHREHCGREGTVPDEPDPRLSPEAEETS